MKCIQCELAHKWAQMFYFSAFITIFQIGWASVQISHLSLIPELAEDPHVRTHLTAIRQEHLTYPKKYNLNFTKIQFKKLFLFQIWIYCVFKYICLCNHLDYITFYRGM